MLKIRKEQMAMFELYLNKRFRAGLKAHVREEFPVESKDMSDEELDRMISLALQRGRAYGVTSEQDVALFLDLMITKGAGFDRDPKLLWMRKILADKESDGTTKMEAIYRRLAVMANRKALPDEIC